ncbi:GNAT family N-acetyltransferase [Gracilimonas sediminicola]|uniref:GNAT family N-acetyltransferase n=1 Tax=Gracilimonas sediminicola TaxID=2952158 RepID=A0A9X2RII6_9BACT|nr:GNAT family N-acetyltransferase [Gracilimonas sediminicola]MCP9292919.1 GNAT family N-acetyltransferase [Gracilimonas sediminicola]
MDVSIRSSGLKDLDLLLKLEQKAFPYFQQSPKRTLDLSLKSTFQQVWIAETFDADGPTPVGSLILYLYKKTIRIFSIVVDPDYQGKGIGNCLLDHVRKLAAEKGAERVSLEAYAEDRKLINWYKKAGFESTELLSDYYEDGKDALRMVWELPQPEGKTRISNVIVVDNPKNWKLELANVEVVSSKEYTSNNERFADRPLRVFNLCNSYKYQSFGYYVSLLASARAHRAIPNVTTIRDFRDLGVIRSIADDIDETIQKSLDKIKESKFVLNVYFGQTVDKSYKALGLSLYQMFESPLFQVHFLKTNRWDIKRIVPLSMNKVPADEQHYIQDFARQYFETKRFPRTKLQNYKYYLAILVNPTEENPPSNKKALKKIEEAADELDIYIEFITKDDYNRLSEFDALFIRETTNVNDYTYQFARKAYAEGLAVIDDPWSILRCSNKIYLHERLKVNNIPTPETFVFYKGMLKEKDLAGLKYPMILKQPDSAFSIGVSKVKDAQEMEESLQRLFKSSDLVIGQEFLPSDFDWRVGVLDNQPLFVCKYFMAKGHWQIYNWKGSKKDQSGEASTLPLYEVPKKVLKAATKAASLMGDGLYGVDLKMLGDKVYVIEVNDNPNIDAGIEDKILGTELYKRIVKSLVTRIEMSRNIERFVSIEPD